jgi:hypothetical protein
MSEIISVCTVSCIALLLIAYFTANRRLAILADLVLAMTFGLISGVLLYKAHYWLGGTFAVVALRQFYVIITPLWKTLPKHHLPDGNNGR